MNQDGRLIKPEALEKLRETIIQLFAEGQYHEVGMRAICQSAKVSPQTVYKYFGSKDQLLLACMEQDMQRLAAHCHQASLQHEDPVDALHQYCIATFEFFADEPLIARIIYLNIPGIYWANQSSPGRELLADGLGKLVKKAQKAGRITKAVPAHWVVDIFTGAANRLLMRWLVEGEKRNMAKEAKKYLHYLTDGLVVDN